MYKEGYVDQVCFTTEKSTFKAFSKASTCNFFGQQHELDPNKDKYDFLVMLDNDIIVTPGWDKKLLLAWDHIKTNKISHIKVVGQLPGGIKNRTSTIYKITDEITGKDGKNGGSGLWSVRPDFFRDVGFLDLKRLVNFDKRHDQNYWLLLERASKGKPYILGINQKLGIHCGKTIGSVCNTLTRNQQKSNKTELIKFEEAEKEISDMPFDDFFNKIQDDQTLIRDW